MPVTTTVKLDLARDCSFSTTISQYLISASVRQGRQKSLDPMQPATAVVKLNNADGRFSPCNTGGPYYPDFDDNYCGIRIEAGTRRFTGYIINIEQDPFIQNREVTLHCTDRLGLLAERVISAGRFRLQPVHLILNRLIDLMEEGEEIDNPGGEDLDGDGSGDTTGYSAAASGTTIDSVSTIAFEGDYCIQAQCDGSLSGQGIRYDLGAAVTSYKVLALLARTAPGDGNTTLTVRGLNAALEVQWTHSIAVVEDAWTHKQFYITPYISSHRYIEIITQSAAALTILLDAFHQAPTSSRIPRSVPTSLDAVVECLGLYEAPALDSLNKLVATEAAGFLYMRDFLELYGNFYASAQAVRDGKTTPSATFGDDGVNVFYVGLSFGLDARERISRAAVRSEGSYEDAGEEATVWELSPAGQLILATESMVVHAHYSQPARGCSLEVATPPTAFELAAETDDGYLRKHGTDTPVVVTDELLLVGTHGAWSPDGARWRSYLRFDSSAIPDAAVLQNAWLKVWLFVSKIEGVPLVYFRVRNAPSWYALSADDWTKGDAEALLGSYAWTDLPPVGEPFLIPIDVSGISKTGYTELRLATNYDEDYPDNEDLPDNRAYIALYSYAFGGTDKRPTLIVQYEGGAFAATALENYGVGGKITLTAGALDAVVPDIRVVGFPLSACSEESVVIAEATTPPAIPRTLPVDMPYQGTRTADMIAEAGRLAERHSGQVRRLRILLQEEDAASLSQMQVRQLDDLVRVINTKWAFSTGLDDTFFIEGMEWEVKDQGRVLEVTLDLEAK